VPDAGVLATLSLGGNEGDVAAAFRYALKRLAENSGVELLKISSVWRTPPWGKTDQPDFLNTAALLRTTLTPRELLRVCLVIESERGRARDIRWGPRTLDIDIITFGSATLDEPDLTIPHPRARERAFVLAPLAEITPETLIGASTARELLEGLDLGGARVIGPLDTTLPRA
jgi:2-amino-4-hydroxy-6-hydroxymethyldihydropteridine diphosphokinase